MHRTPGLIRRGHPELYRVAMAVSGSPYLAQDGRAARLRPGQFTIYDFNRPYELAYDSGVELAVFSFPREMFALPVDLVTRLTAVPIATQKGAAGCSRPRTRRWPRGSGTGALNAAVRIWPIHRCAPSR